MLPLPSRRPVLACRSTQLRERSHASLHSGQPPLNSHLPASSHHQRLVRVQRQAHNCRRLPHHAPAQHTTCSHSPSPWFTPSTGPAAAAGDAACTPTALESRQLKQGDASVSMPQHTCMCVWKENCCCWRRLRLAAPLSNRHLSHSTAAAVPAAAGAVPFCCRLPNCQAAVATKSRY
jgi:hypothetical protein